MKGLLKYCSLDRFVALDLETTGLDPLQDEIIEIAMVRFENAEPADVFHSLVAPVQPLTNEIVTITGIREEDLAGKPGISDLTEEIFSFLSGDPVIAHSSDFVSSFLENQLGSEFKNPVHDTLTLSQILFPTLPSHTLVAVCEALRLNAPEDASAGAESAGVVFLRLLDRLAQQDLRILRKANLLLRPTRSDLKPLFRSVSEYLQQNTVEPLHEPMVELPVPVNVIGEAPQLRKIERDPEPIESSEIEEVFLPGGKLAHGFARYEERLQQTQMSQSCADAFNRSEFLTCEAGTGTGKSLAYLVPAILWSSKNRSIGEYVVVSTNTKNLQEQLFLQDLPLLKDILGVSFKAVLLKGRNNYICMRKWEKILQEPDVQLGPWEREKLLTLLFWVEETQTGDISENQAFQQETNRRLWRKLESESGFCTLAKCREYKCPLLRIRNEAKTAHVIVVNHSLLFSDLVSGNAILGDYTNLVIDEAHNLEKTAAGYLGMDLNLWQFKNLAESLYDKQPVELGTLPLLARQVETSGLSELKKNSLGIDIRNAIEQTEVIRDSAQEFFRRMTSVLIQKGPSYGRQKERYKKDHRIFDEAGEEAGRIEDEMETLAGLLESILGELKELRTDAIEDQEEIVEALQNRRRECHGLANVMGFLMEAEDANHVFWYELPWKEGSIDCRFFAVPLNVAEILAEKLYERLNSLILTSATLAVAGDFSYYNNRVGLDRMPDEQVRTLAVGSPFLYDEQTLVGVTGFLPDPASPAFTSAVVELIDDLARRYRRGTLALFTSYSMMNQAADQLKSMLAGSGIRLMVQGRDGSRTNLTARFRADRESILFGTDSFWEGVDVPGKALEMVILVKLPFDVPSDPIVAAKMEKIETEGGRPFFEFSVPEAVIRFRQGFGRLIRSAEDQGVVLVLDTRTVKKRYGSAFLQSLPAGGRILNTREALFARLDDFWGSPA